MILHTHLQGRRNGIKVIIHALSMLRPIPMDTQILVTELNH